VYLKEKKKLRLQSGEGTIYGVYWKEEYAKLKVFRTFAGVGQQIYMQGTCQIATRKRQEPEDIQWRGVRGM